MSGHSKWSSIKHRKAARDSKRGKIFTRLGREITIAARDGGGDPDANARLRTAIAGARAANMPKDNISRALQRGTGELPGVNYDSITYEGYGPSGVALIVETLTDNKNRTAAEIRHLFLKYGGSLGETGSVGWMFKRRGQVVVARAAAPDEERLMEIVLESGAEDFDSSDPEVFIVLCAPDELHVVREYLEAEGLQVEAAELVMEASNPVTLEGAAAAKVERMIDVFDDQDDVQNVWSNAEPGD